MLRNAAHGDGIPRAPRSLSCGRRRAGPRALALVASAAFWATLAGCEGGGPTLPGDASYVAILSGANQRPPRATAGRGTATFDVRGGIASYAVLGSDLTGPPTVVHLLIGGRETVGIPIASLALAAPSGTLAAGTIDLRGAITFNNTTISGDSLRALFENGNAYVNVYTATYPTGEVRGQVERVR